MTMSVDYQLPLPPEPARRQAVQWLILAVASLLFAGVLTLLLVLSRMPGAQEIIPWIDFFHVALVVHVDLSVLVWFLAFAGVFWNMAANGERALWGKAALGLAWAGAVIITLAPFLGAQNPFQNNYIPVLDDPIFFCGLGLFTAGFLILALQALLTLQPRGASGVAAVRFGIRTSVWIGLLALVAFGLSLRGLMGQGVEGEEYFEMLFWGPGHVIQFTHTQLMLAAWLWLGSAAGIFIALTPRLVLILLALGAAPTLATPAIYALSEVWSVEHHEWMAAMMWWGGGLAALPLGLAAVIGAFSPHADREGRKKPEFAALFSSIVLFGVGGLVGYLISGINVTIPAHYHGSTVSVTIAFMGIAYHLLPRLGYELVWKKWVYRQPIIYMTGQLLHVAGLAWSGGYGVQRKTAGAAQGLDALEKKIAMGLMGFGGLISMVGGTLFLIIAILVLKRGRRAP